MLVAMLFAFTLIGIGLNEMGFFASDKSELRLLLGKEGEVLVDGATVDAWQIDPDYKPRAYYAIRKIDEQGFRQLVAQVGLIVIPNPVLSEAIWKLPDDVRLEGWIAPSMPLGAGLQAQGAIGGGNAWLRWYDGMMFLVVLRAS